MRLIDQLMSHPLMDERPIDDVLKPLGFEIHVELCDTPDPDDEPESAERFEDDPNSFMDALPFDIPEGFTEIARFDTENCEIVMLAVKPTTQISHLLMTKADDPTAVLG